MKLKALSEKKKAEMIRAVLLLRFRRTDPGPRSTKFLSYAKIAGMLNLTVNEVAHQCRKAQAAPNSLKKQKDPARRLE